ncbi:D-isomer specific 2-hydroxyacid dehydrogenase [Rhodofomes roseus]|uniref:D-isomer specific 2-hydroxyacid dehydrogenase n=1 Tax=Rhodofomes roseus TaxID=34475 RepID=A0ABQ8KGU1_9APHY|nr:D-isomer specific 2-hydroxyacid dehydrogenase [Rhodofomes roseus]KAH9836553.1 D-isomer specific 2-hydroxyacid dehydrogenase [Rhodofomes roseus]
MSSILHTVSSTIQSLSGAWRPQSNNAPPNGALSTATMSSNALFEHILVLNVPLPDAHRALLAEHSKNITHIPSARTPGSVPDEAYRKADVIYGFPTGLESWAQVPSLKFVQLDSAGADSVVRGKMWHEERAEKVVMATVAGIHMAPISQHFIMTTLALFHHLQEQILVAQVDKRWGKDTEFGGQLFVQELKGKTVGVLGYGHIGRECARLSAAFGAKVLAATSDGQQKPQTGYVEDGMGDPDGNIPEAWYSTKDEEAFKEFLSKCDVLLLALPSTGATHHILSSATIGYLPSHAIIVNIGRGDAVDTDALLEALDEKKLAGAALDVVEGEPLADGHPLFGRKDVLITPHLSGRTTMYLERSIHIFAENLRRLREGQQVWNQVDYKRGY